MGRSSEKQDRRGRPEASRRPERRGGAPDPTDPKPITPPGQLRAAEPDASPIETGPAADRLGAVGLQRLRARHTEILSRIQARVEDATRRAELNALAARLNPDEWGSDDAVVAGLEGYETTYDALKNAIGGRRKAPASADAPGSEAAEPGDSTVSDGSE